MDGGLAPFKRSHSAGKGGRPPRIRAHTQAVSDNYDSVKRSRTPRASTPRNKLKSKKRERASSVGKKSKKDEAHKVESRHIHTKYLSNQDSKILFTMKNCQHTMNELDKTHEKTKKSLQEKFEKLQLKLKEQQLKLEKDLNHIVIKKKNILQTQYDALTTYKERFSVIHNNFNTNNDKQTVLGFLNDANNLKYNVGSIQCDVSSNIMLKLNENEINEIISEWGCIESGEVPLFPPIIKVINKTPNTIQVKCFEPKNANQQSLPITTFEIEYVLLPKQWKKHWKKQKKTIFDIINNDYGGHQQQQHRHNDDEKKTDSIKSSKVSTKIMIDKDKNFKKNVVLISNLEFGCDYLIRSRCYNICGFGPWIAPKMISIYDVNNEGKWEFSFDSWTENMSSTDNNKTITKISGKNEWDSLAIGPTFPINFIESQMKIYWMVKINNCHSADIGSLHFGIMSKKIKPEDVWSESIGFAEYESIGMEKYESSPTFKNQSIVKIVVDFKQNIVQFYENDKFLAMQKLTALKQKIADLCFGVGSYRKKNSISLI